MRVPKIIRTAVLLVVSASAALPVLAQASPQSAQQPTAPTAQQQQQPAALAAQEQPAQQPASAPAAQEPTQQPTQEAAVPLRVMVGKSILINTADRLKRVSITDPVIADAVVVTPHQLMIHGRAPGEVTLVVWDDQERSRSFDLAVDVDVTAAAQEIKQLMPTANINVSASRGALILSGYVNDKETADRAASIASAYSRSVINVLTYGAQGAQEVLLEVHFAEVDRSTLLQLGANILSTGAANTPGTVTTGQFGNVGGPVDITGVIGAGLTGTSTSLKAIDPLNLFLFRPDLNLGATLRLLQQKNLLQILAEPNLIAVNGKEASFLAGGEFPVPVPQTGVAAGTITIQFKEFGVRLHFLPIITPSGTIHLTVQPEVSSLDFVNGLSLSGFRVPALTVRRASTELELLDGQSFVIAGLLDNRLSQNLAKLPGIGDIPILGYLFRSKEFTRNRTELIVLVTAHRISPTNQPPAGPTMPKPFMDEKKFDKAGGGFLP
jgi:pilus assembly protein CpaC